MIFNPNSVYGELLGVVSSRQMILKIGNSGRVNRRMYEVEHGFGGLCKKIFGMKATAVRDRLTNVGLTEEREFMARVSRSKMWKHLKGEYWTCRSGTSPRRAIGWLEKEMGKFADQYRLQAAAC